MRTATKETCATKDVEVKRGRKPKDSLRLYIRSDPNNFWLCVPRTLIARFGLVNKISSQSFQRKTTVFLDRNKDIPTFTKAVEQHGLSLKTVELHTSRHSKILKYNPYTPRNRDLFQ